MKKSLVIVSVCLVLLMSLGVVSAAPIKLDRAKYAINPHIDHFKILRYLVNIL